MSTRRVDHAGHIPEDVVEQVGEDVNLGDRLNVVHEIGVIFLGEAGERIVFGYTCIALIGIKTSTALLSILSPLRLRT